MTVMPNRFNVIGREKFVQNLPEPRYYRLFPLWCSFGGILKKLIVLNPHVMTIIIVSEVNLDFLSAAGFLVACYLHLPADHHLASCIRRDLAFHVEHEAFSGSSGRNVNLKRSLNILLR